MKIQKGRGFTLIELMIVVAIIGVLMAIAIPQYQKYVIRSKASQAIQAMRPVQTTIDEYAQLHQDFPAVGLVNIGVDDAALEVATCNGIVKLVKYAGANGNTTATITVTFYSQGDTTGNANCQSSQIANMPTQLDAKTIIFTGTRRGTNVTWTTTGGTLDPEIRPVLKDV